MKKLFFIIAMAMLFSGVIYGDMSDEKTLKYMAFAAAKSDYKAIHTDGTMAFHTAYRVALTIESYLRRAGIYVPYSDYWLQAFKRQVNTNGAYMEYSQKEYIAYLKMYISLAQTIRSVM